MSNIRQVKPMVEPPKSIYGKVHCTTVIQFSKKEEQSMLNEYKRTFLFRAVNDRPGKSFW